MKKWTKKLIPSTLTVFLLASIPFNFMSVPAYASSVGETQVEQSVESTVETQTTSEKATTETPIIEEKLTYEEQRMVILSAIAQAKSNRTAESMKSAMELFFQLPVLEKYTNQTHREDKYNFTERILDSLDLLTDEAAKTELKEYFAVEAVKMLEKSKHLYDFGVADAGIKLLPEGELRTQLTATFKKLQDEVFGDIEDEYIDWLNPPDDLVVDQTPWEKPDNEVPLPDGSNNHLPPGGSNNQKPDPPTTTKPETYERTEIKYKVIGNVCYKVLVRYNGGKIVKEERTTPDQYEAIFCGAGETDHSDHEGEGHIDNPFPNAGTGSGYIKNPTDVKFEGYDPFDPDMRDELMEQENEQNLLEPITIQYTFNKASESPYFYDTGITIGEEKLLTYEQAKDALHQIAVQSKGEYVEDADKVLALIDGKILVVKNENRTITFDEFAKMFNDTSAGVRALDTRTGGQLDLADLVEVKGVKTVTIKGKEVKLTADPVVDNSIVLFPVEQVAKELGGTVIAEDNKLTVQNGDHTLIYEMGKTFVNYDGKDVSIHVAIRTNKEGVMMAPIRALADAFDKTVEVDSEASRVVIQ